MTWPVYRGMPCDGDYSAVIAGAVAELGRFDVVGLLEDCKRSVALGLIKLDIAPTKVYPMRAVMPHLHSLEREREKVEKGLRE